MTKAANKQITEMFNFSLDVFSVLFKTHKDRLHSFPQCHLFIKKGGSYIWRLLKTCNQDLDFPPTAFC